MHELNIMFFKIQRLLFYKGSLYSLQKFDTPEHLKKYLLFFALMNVYRYEMQTFTKYWICLRIWIRIWIKYKFQQNFFTIFNSNVYKKIFSDVMKSVKSNLLTLNALQVFSNTDTKVKKKKINRHHEKPCFAAHTENVSYSSKI